MTYDLNAEQLEAELQVMEMRLADSGDAAHAAAVELARKIKDDEALVDILRKETAPASIKMAIDEVRFRIAHATIADANSAFRTLRNRLDYMSQLIQGRRIIAGVERANGQSKGGQASKRRKWADILADELYSEGYDRQGAWDALDQMNDGITVDLVEREYRFYREGQTIYCDDAQTGAEIGRMACSTFFDKGRYFRHSSN